MAKQMVEQFDGKKPEHVMELLYKDPFARRSFESEEQYKRRTAQGQGFLEIRPCKATEDNKPVSKAKRVTESAAD